MSIRIKLVVIILFVALVPLAISAFSTLSIHQRAFDAKVVDSHRTSAKVGAALVDSRLSNYRKTLSQAVASIEWTALTAAERDGALWLVYRQLDEIAVASLLNEKGDGLGPSAYMDKAHSVNQLKAHPRVTLQVLEMFASRLPFADALQKGFGVGEAFRVPGQAELILPVALKVPTTNPSGGWVVACGLSLTRLCKEIEQMGTEGTEVYLVDPLNRLVCGPKSASLLSDIPANVEAHTAGNALVDFRYRNPSGEEVLAAVAPIGSGFAIVVEQLGSLAFASGRRMMYQTVFWLMLSIVVATVTGLLLGRSISGPVKRLVTGASELAKGNFSYRLKAKGKDELADLSNTFDRMSGEIEKKDQEIREWNQELQTRVDDKTKELKEVEEQLIHSQKISAVVSLGAGIAHEINNPLASVLGYTQLLKGNARKDESLAKYNHALETIELQSNRIKDIVTTFIRFTETVKGADFIEINLFHFLGLIVQALEPEFQEKRIELKMECEGEIRDVYGDLSKLRQSFNEIIKNSCTAMPDGGTLSITVSMVEDRVVKTVITDTGMGIAPEHIEQIFEPFYTTKTEWSSEGLGLTLTFKNIEEHAGKIKVESQEGEGTTMTIFLPAHKGGAHLG